ncbi:hypothetical protein [Gracilibacillus alcaliphilus]|uniref:hypothetical protein n=1 Tax=Gracilibacillus alcaliphilus TaxID=1401441 RepID=UPI001956E6B1|nr:hypothetical protein [Gracilibacillus alcaliphilus]MBM7675476.1 hypothetical protein [Gracilibacillus alcaliphilus]
MRKLLILILSMFFLLAACGETANETGAAAEEDSTSNEETDSGSEEEADESSETEEAASENENSGESESSTYDEILLDDDNVKVVLTEIETESDDIFGDQHNIKMEIENKLDETIEVQSREVSVDGFMVDDMVVFSETVAGGKKSNAELTIMAFDEELPELNENIEFKLMILDEDFMEVTSADVTVDIK